jgi:hypothetical protein
MAFKSSTPGNRFDRINWGRFPDGQNNWGQIPIVFKTKPPSGSVILGFVVKREDLGHDHGAVLVAK